MSARAKKSSRERGKTVPQASAQEQHPAGRALRQFIVVSYDIPDDRRRSRVCHLLKDYGRRVQYSVFECELRREDLERMQERLRPLLNLEEDDVRFYALCRECRPRARVWGPRKRQPLREAIIV